MMKTKDRALSQNNHYKCQSANSMIPVIVTGKGPGYLQKKIMEKILLMMDGLDVNINTIRFACYLSRLTHSKLTGIFIENPVEQEEITIARAETADTLVESIYVKKTREDNERIKEENIHIFQDVVEQEDIETFIDADETLTTIDVVHKTRFSDILVIDGKAFQELYEEVPNSFVKEVLQEAECPVVIAPEEFDSIDDIVFCYNGMKSSVFAMKQFTYLFPELRNKRVKVINLSSDQEISEDDEKAITGWLGYHYKDVEFTTLGNDALNAFFTYLLKKKNDFVVMGAYGKGLLAAFFETRAEERARTTRLPLFIAHY